MSIQVPPFPAAMNDVDCKFILLEHYVRHADSGMCISCQDAILYHFYILSEHHNTGLRLHPAHLDPRFISRQNALHVANLLSDALTWRTQNKADFDALLHNTWLAMFESAKDITDVAYNRLQQAVQQQSQPSPPQGRTPQHSLQPSNPQYPGYHHLQQRADAARYLFTIIETEEMLTKLWHACAGRYTTDDALRGRPYAGYINAFEEMHVRRLVSLQQPGSGDRCQCADRTFRFPAGAGLPPTDWLKTGPHVPVLMKYTDPLIREIYGWVCRELVRRGRASEVKPLAGFMKEKKTRDNMVALVACAEAKARERKAKEEAERKEVFEAATALMMLKTGWFDKNQEQNNQEHIEDTIVVRIDSDSSSSSDTMAETESDSN